MPASSRVFVDLEDGKTARTAAKAIPASASKRAALKLSAKGRMLSATIEASDFTSMRALTTTLLRDLKVFLDSTKEVGKGVRRKVK